jgi:hypothetical protein
MKHKFNDQEIGYDLVKNIKEFFCERCQKLIAIQKTPKSEKEFVEEWSKDCILEDDFEDLYY